MSRYLIIANHTLSQLLADCRLDIDRDWISLKSKVAGIFDKQVLHAGRQRSHLTDDEGVLLGSILKTLLVGELCATVELYGV